jgi:cellulose biosynthesis protein BcsQ
MAQGQVITLYSYKGGTGRTMALANIATLLAEQHTVLMMDWDLDAPGLHYFFADKINFHDGILEKAGLVELFEEMNNLLSNHKEWIHEDSANDLFNSIDIKNYLHSVSPDHLFLLAAGSFKNNYAQRATTFQWENLFKRAPWLFRAFATRLAGEFDYVLIDSRTGLNDISGVCTALMPETLVAIFTPNNQSITGVITIIQNALNYRRESEDLRPLNVFPLPSRVELQEKELFDKWRFGSAEEGIKGYQLLFEEFFKKSYDLEACDLNNYFTNFQIQQQAYYAYGERIAVSEQQGTGRLSIKESYEIFTERLVKSIAPWSDQGNQLAVMRTQLLSSSLPSEVLRGMGQVRKWLQEEPENQDIYALLLDVVHDNPVLREGVRNLLEEMRAKGSKSSEDALSHFPVAVPDLLADADDAYYAAEYDQAVDLYRKVLLIEPNNQRAQRQLEKALLNRSEETRNKDIPRQAFQYFRQARSYISAGEITTAIKLLNAAIEEARANKKEFPDAEKQLDSLQDVLNANENKGEAALAIREERWEDALNLYKRARPLDPSDETIQRMCDILQDLLDAEKLIVSLSDVHYLTERKDKLGKIASSLNASEEIKNLVSTPRYKKVHTRYSLYKAEADLGKWGIFKALAPQGRVKQAKSIAKNVIDPQDSAMQYIDAQLKRIWPFRIGAIVVSIVLVFAMLLFLIGEYGEPLQWFTHFNTPTITVTSTSIPTATMTPSMTPLPTSTLTATATLTSVATPTPLAYGYVVLVYVTTFDSPNGKKSGTIEGKNVPVTIIDVTVVSADTWYFCTWEINGTVGQGWIRAEYVQFGPTPIP